MLEDGSPKLLDFGIAKLIHPFQGSDAELAPEGSERLLTPDYASPEQLQGKPVSTATDVYALGVLLFELLTGELPFAGSRDKPDEQARAICEDQPELPGSVCLRSRHLPASDARKMRGDLDAIILKMLAKEPGQRYASASQLLAELDRYFAGFAVEATVVYHMKKFVRRHRTGAVLTAVSALLIVAFVLAMAWLAQRATRGEALARREQEFLSSIFKAATPEGSKGESVTARQLLDQAAGRLDTELASDPRLQAEMTKSIGESYISLGLYSKAQPLLERALQLAAQGQGESSALYSDDLSDLATDYRLQGQFAAAEPLFRRVVALNQKLHGQASLAFAQSMSGLGECLYYEDKDTEAEQFLRRALAIERPHRDLKEDGTRNYLALTLERKGAYPEAAALLREASDISAWLEGKQSQDYLISMHDLAGAQIDMGDLEGAVSSEKEVLDTRQKIWGRDHPDTAFSLNNLGWIMLEEGRWQQAEPFVRETLQITRKLSAAPGPRYATALGNLGRVFEQKGDFAAAADSFEQAMQVLDANGMKDSSSSAKILLYQSALELDRAYASEAIRLANRALSVQTSLGGDSNPQRASGLLALGLANLLAGNHAAAEDLFRRALDIRQHTFPPTHPELLTVKARLVEALHDEKKPQAALDQVESARSVCPKSSPLNNSGSRFYAPKPVEKRTL